MKKRKTSFDGRNLGKEDWFTPKYIVEPLGHFDLDPCTGDVRPFDIADVSFTKTTCDGLLYDWHGRVWMNPPYGNKTEQWLAKLAKHGNGIALIFARTETKMFFNSIWTKADAILFLRGRVSFLNPDGSKGKYSGGAPSCLVAYGKENAEILSRCKLPGMYIALMHSISAYGIVG